LQPKGDNSMAIALRGSKQRGKFILAFALAALMSLSAVATFANAASSGEVQVFASADDASPVIESVSDGRALAPIAEMTGAGGVKWFMVKTKSGNVGWIKAGDVSAAKNDDHFRALPKDSATIGSAGAASEDISSTSKSGAITVPVKVLRSTVFVPVSFKHGNSTASAYLALDTGAGQTMISKRIAKDLRLFAIESQRHFGVGGTVVADMAVVDAVRVGSAVIRQMPVTIHDLSGGQGIEGLLGFDFLGRFQMSVDSEKQVLVLTPRGK
jgi:hypothetical protein